jgi:putative endonuclease
MPIRDAPRQYAVYITASWRGVLYTGVTSGLETRIAMHKAKLAPGFTAKYNVDRLVWYELTSDVHIALAREKQIKGWTRAKKVALISAFNPDWKDLGAHLGP